MVPHDADAHKSAKMVGIAGETSCPMFTLHRQSVCRQDEICCEVLNFIRIALVYSVYIYKAFGGSGAGQHYLVALLLPVISTNQGCISDVFTVPKCPQRNM